MNTIDYLLFLFVTFDRTPYGFRRWFTEDRCGTRARLRPSPRQNVSIRLFHTVVITTANDIRHQTIVFKFNVV